MLTAIPLRPDQELLIEGLRVPAPRPVRYIPWVRNTRFVILNGWVAATLLAQWLVLPTGKITLITIALLSAAVILALECHFRYRFYLLSRGEATVGVVVSRKIVKNGSGESFRIGYCYWTRTGKMRQENLTVPKDIYNTVAEGGPITILHTSKFWLDSLPLLLVGEVELV